MVAPRMTPVTSSNVQEVGYDRISRQLHVKFASGTYVYHDVPAEKHAALMAADRIGVHLHAHIKGVHRSTKLEAKPDRATEALFTRG